MKPGSLLLAALCFLGPISVRADGQTPAAPDAAEVTIPSSQRITFSSAINGESYTLLVRVPLMPPPPEGYPVIYVLDGDTLFGMAGDIALGMQGPRRAPIVVGIGYGAFYGMQNKHEAGALPRRTAEDLRAFNTRRLHDLTLHVAAAHRAPDWTGLTPANAGGADIFLKIIESEIKPRIAAAARINPKNQALFGHSIGGLTVLRALFTEPGAFRTFIAASPSIWWDGDAVLADESRFRALAENRDTSPRILLTVGADEPDSPNPPSGFMASLSPERASALKTYLAMAGRWSGMVSGARGLAERLSAVKAAPDYKAAFVAFADEDHASVVPAALSRGMRFAFD